MVEDIDLSNTVGLHTKAILVNVTIGVWSGRKFDDAATKTVAENFGAHPDCGRFNKLLIDRNAILSLYRVGSRARHFHYTNTLPWNDVGTRLLPTKAHHEYVVGINKFIDEFWTEVNAFYEKYPELVDARRAALGELWKEDDYPTINQLKNAFNFKVSFMFLPDPRTDIRLNLNEVEIEKIRESMANTHHTITKKSESDLWCRMRKVVDRIVERLDDPNKIFKNSTFNNIDELERLVTMLNVTDNTDIDNTMLKIKNDLKEYSPEEIRTDHQVRKNVHKKAQDILSSIESFI